MGTPVVRRYIVAIILMFATCVHAAGPSADPGYAALKERLAATYGHVTPREWGERVTGVRTRLATAERVIALTFDACGSGKGMGLDTRLIAFLEKEQVPATLFINSRWIGPNRAAFDRLAANPLFEIANHGTQHRPASVSGRSVYGIDGTRSVADLVDEVEPIEALPGAARG